MLVVVTLPNLYEFVQIRTSWYQFPHSLKKLGPAASGGLFLRYAHAYLSQVSQSSACNRARSIQERLTRAAFLPARNDVLANVTIVGAGLVTAYRESPGRT